MTAHVHVVGRVQGVSFRAYTEREARRLGVGGWVRNLADGRVEAWFSGPRDAVAEAVDWCRRGSPAAVVDDVAVVWDAPDPRGGAGEPGFAVVC
ncbi:MAG: acylphosphatase [Myxococcota bacterium]